MAVNVNTVYRTVLLILNKEQRGYLTPDEFNRIGGQVQLDIFNEYFEDLNQHLRVPTNDTEYSDRIKTLEEKISVFQTEGNTIYDSNTQSFELDTTQQFADPFELYKLGTVIYDDIKEVQYVQPNELLEINLSPITKPSKYWPVYVYKNYRIHIYPKDITDKITCTYLRKPLDPIWGFNTSAPSYQYIYNPNLYNSVSQPTGSRNFELNIEEQTNLIIKILLYAGVVIKDAQIVQAAAQQIQSENVNSKS